MGFVGTMSVCMTARKCVGQAEMWEVRKIIVSRAVQLQQ